MKARHIYHRQVYSLFWKRRFGENGRLTHFKPIFHFYTLGNVRNPGFFDVVRVYKNGNFTLKWVNAKNLKKLHQFPSPGRLLSMILRLNSRKTKKSRCILTLKSKQRWFQIIWKTIQNVEKEKPERNRIHCWSAQTRQLKMPEWNSKHSKITLLSWPSQN